MTEDEIQQHVVHLMRDYGRTDYALSAQNDCEKPPINAVFHPQPTSFASLVPILHRLPPIPFLSSTTSRSGCRNYASNKPPGFAKP